MADIPRAVLSERFQERMQGRVLKTGVFFTFSFDPGFFEQEILPAFLDVPLSHEAAVRLIQLDDAIRQRVDHLAVYYDPRAVEAGSAGGQLAVRRIPVLWPTGYFHPKNVLLLVEDAEADEAGFKEQRLLAATLSANLTEQGWWRNVEACHIEELRTTEKSSLAGDLSQLVARIRRAAPAEEEHAALGEIERFLRRVPERVQSTSDGRLNPRLYVGAVDGRGAGQSVPDFLAEVRGRELHGRNLEVISPFFDDTGDAGTLRRLVEDFEPLETRVYLPRALDGAAECSEVFFNATRKLPNTRWGKLPADLLQTGKDESAAPRRVHAKVYRFFSSSPAYEALLVGSVNLTAAAHQKGGNFETAFLIETEPSRPPDWWLAVEGAKPSEFKCESEKDEAASQGPGIALGLRYSWETGAAEAFWDRPEESPVLEIESLGTPLFTLRPLRPDRWVRLGAEEAKALAGLLPQRSLVTVKIAGKESADILVQETGMAHKPSILLNLSVADILRCWAALTPEQKTVLLEERYQELANVASALLPKAPLGRLETESIFDAFAGVFHAFACLERSVLKAFSEKRWNEAVHLLFGRKYDSLPHLLERVLRPPASDGETAVPSDGNHASVDQLPPVNRYVILLCAQQLLNRVREEAPAAFRQDHREGFRQLEGILTQKAQVEEQLSFGMKQEKDEFLRWFEGWFLTRATPLAETGR